jgi:hypothetical protein
MNTGIGSSGEPGGAKAEANNFDIGYRTWLWDATFQALAKHWSLQSATSQRPIVLAPEGLPLDPGVTLNCGIRHNLNSCLGQHEGGLLLKGVAPADEEKLRPADTRRGNRDIIAASPKISCPLRR